MGRARGRFIDKGIRRGIGGGGQAQLAYAPGRNSPGAHMGVPWYLSIAENTAQRRCGIK